MAIQTLFLTGFEHGFTGTPVQLIQAASVGAGLWDVRAGTAFAVGSTTPRSGTYCGHLVNPASVANSISKNITGAPTKVVFRFGVKVSALPASGLATIAIITTTSGNAQVQVSSLGVIQVQAASGTVRTGPTLNTTNWYLLELQLDVTATWTLDWRVNGVAQTQATGGTAVTVSSLILGTNLTTQQAFTVDYDDLIFGTWATAASDWYGDGQCLGQIAGSDGTHATVTAFSPGDAGTAYSGTVTTAWTQLTVLPWTNARSTTVNVAQRTINTAAYMEVAPATTAQAGAANGVMALVSYSSSLTQANTEGAIALNSGAAVKVVAGDLPVAQGGLGGALISYGQGSNFFGAGLVPVPAATWTASQVNAVRFRVGGSNDVTPAPTVQAVMLEVDWPPVTPAVVAATAQATATVTAPVAAPMPFTASAGATATVTAAVTAPRLITASAASTTAATSLGAYGLVGSLGAPVTSASGGAISGLAYGQTPTAGNLLVCWWIRLGVSGIATTPSGWTAHSAKSGGASMTVQVYTRVAAGGDAVPAFAGLASSTQTVMLGEFSGNANLAAHDQTGTASPGGVTSPQSATLAAADASAGELVCYATGVFHSAGVTDTESVTVNGAAGHDTTNNATSTTDHYDLGWAITTSNASSDVTQFSFNATSVTTWAITANSFSLVPVPVKVTAASQIAPAIQATATVTATLTARQLIAAPISSTATMTAVVFTSNPAPFAASMAATSLMTCDLTAPFLPPPPERRQYVHAVYVRI